MIKRVLISTVILLLAVNLHLFAQPDLEKTENSMKSAIQREDQAQKSVESWVNDKEDLVSEIRTIQTTNTWLEYHNRIANHCALYHQRGPHQLTASRQ